MAGVLRGNFDISNIMGSKWYKVALIDKETLDQISVPGLMSKMGSTKRRRKIRGLFAIIRDLSTMPFNSSPPERLHELQEVLNEHKDPVYV